MNNNTPSDYYTNYHFDGLAKSLNSTVVLVDPEKFKIQYINQIQPGFNLNEVIGKEAYLFVFPEYIEQYKNLLLNVVKTHVSESITMEVMDVLSVKKWYQCVVSPIKNNEGIRESLIVISNDITNEKLKEINISNNQEKIYSIINNTKDIILSIDKELNITELNSVFKEILAYGYKENEPLGKPILNYIDHKKHNNLKEIYNKVFSGGFVVDIEKFETTPNNYNYFETSYHPIKNFEKEIIGISIFSKDITERVLNEIQLKHSLKERDVLLYEIHHRIKNNLALVSSMLQIKELSIDNEEAKEIFSDSRLRIKSTALVHEMLYRNDRFDNISLKEYVLELFNNIKIKPSLKLTLSGDDYFLQLDKSFSFGLLMHELIMNSMKHAFKDNNEGELKINIEKLEHKLLINYFESSGKFSADVIFNDPVTTGLILIQTFIQQLDGTIELTSKEPTSFKIEIPIG